MPTWCTSSCLRSNSEQCAAFTLVQLYIECTISATMPNYAGSSRKLYQNENYVCSNHNDIKNAFIPFRNKEINVCLATNSSPACCATPNLSTGRDPPPPCAEAFNSPKCGPPRIFLVLRIIFGYVWLVHEIEIHHEVLQSIASSTQTSCQEVSSVEQVFCSVSFTTSIIHAACSF